MQDETTQRTDHPHSPIPPLTASLAFCVFLFPRLSSLALDDIVWPWLPSCGDHMVFFISILFCPYRVLILFFIFIRLSYAFRMRRRPLSPLWQ